SVSARDAASSLPSSSLASAHSPTAEAFLSDGQSAPACSSGPAAASPSSACPPPGDPATEAGDTAAAAAASPTACVPGGDGGDGGEESERCSGGLRGGKQPQLVTSSGIILWFL
ncbi:unnamed protein product, partial [Ectocarpus fasciculatus]